MKMTMKKTITKSLWTAGLAVFVATPVLAAPHGHGTDILHFSIREDFQNQGVEPNASGHVQASQNQQGHANNQTLDITAKGLMSGTNYALFALLGSDTSLTSITNFITDANGNVTIHYRSVGHGHGGGKDKIPLPDALNPVSNIRELDIADAGGTVVLAADFTAPDKLHLLVKRNLSANGVSAELMIKASSTNHAQLSVMASGLTQSSDYSLALDGAPVQTGTSDRKGKLHITTRQDINILSVSSVALWDSSSNVVVSTTLP
jgi:hypothetical protein